MNDETYIKILKRFNEFCDSMLKKNIKKNIKKYIKKNK
tara:strand:+ start:327 stop:440 length:114 start_codon:yes stop_codon:yes gene_type:complete